MSTWPADARVEGSEETALEPQADRSTVGGDAGVADQVDRATAPRRMCQIRFLCRSDTAAAAWIAWAVVHCHRWFTGLPGAGSTARHRVVGGLAGVSMSPYNTGGGRRGWTGEATVESPEP